jgi:4-amino-4-deoxy-L-arabinose transferase-like glycosyltransferase
MLILNQDPPRPRTALALLLAFCVFFPGATAIWLVLHRAPPNWDDSWYLTTSLQMFDHWVERGILGYAKGFLSVLGVKAPLITALPLPFYLIFGRRWHAAYLVNLTAMPVFFAALYWICRRLGSSRVGLIAVYTAATMPLLYGLSRWYLVEYPLTVCVTITIALLFAETEGAGVLFCCGVTIGLGSLLKITYPLFVVAPLVHFLVRSRDRKRAVVLLALPAVAIAAPWYVLNYRQALTMAWDSAYGLGAVVQGTGPILAFSSIAEYLRRIARNGTSEYYLAMAVALAVLSLIRGGKEAKPREAWVLVVLWLAPFPVFLFGGNKEVRFIAPLLPAVAIGFALLMERMLKSYVGSQRWQNGLTCLVLAYPLLSMGCVSFAIPEHAAPRSYAHLYSPDEWLQEKILALIALRTPLRPGEQIRLLLGSDRGSFNANNFELTAVAERLPFAINTVAYENDLAAVLNDVDSSPFVVYKDGGEPESPFFGRFHEQMVEHILHDARFTEIPFEGRLPDGGRVRLFSNARSKP